MYYPEELVEEIRSKNDIVDVISKLCETSEKRKLLLWIMSIS